MSNTGPKQEKNKRNSDLKSKQHGVSCRSLTVDMFFFRVKQQQQAIIIILIWLTVTIYYIYVMAALSNSFLVNNFLHQIDEEWAVELVGLHMKVQGYWWNWSGTDGCQDY